MFILDGVCLVCVGVAVVFVIDVNICLFVWYVYVLYEMRDA